MIIEDGRQNNGGKTNAGRKPKAEELRLVKLGTDAITKAFGSEELLWEHIADKAKTSQQHLKHLLEYVYGKPKERKEVDLDVTGVTWNETKSYDKPE